MKLKQFFSKEKAIALTLFALPVGAAAQTTRYEYVCTLTQNGQSLRFCVARESFPTHTESQNLEWNATGIYRVERYQGKESCVGGLHSRITSKNGQLFVEKAQRSEERDQILFSVMGKEVLVELKPQPPKTLSDLPQTSFKLRCALNETTRAGGSVSKTMSSPRPKEYP